jgi:hypothetical protein
LQVFVAVTAQRIPSHVIGEDVEDVRARGPDCVSDGSRSENGEQQREEERGERLQHKREIGDCGRTMTFTMLK